MSDSRNNEQSQKTKTHVFRLLPHQDLKSGISEYSKANSIKAGCIVTCVGSLEKINIRFANKKEGTKLNGYFEILSLTGTLSDSALHLHISVADGNGTVTGGHLLEENIIYTTAELVVSEFTDLEFVRESDSTYGYHEIRIKKVKPS